MEGEARFVKGHGTGSSEAWTTGTGWSSGSAISLSALPCALHPVALIQHPPPELHFYHPI